MTTKTEPRIRWTAEECSRLGQAALPLLIADAKLSIVDSLRRVQDTVLPEERRRGLPTVGLVPTELRMWLEQRRRAATGKEQLVPAEDLQRLQQELQETRAALGEQQGETEHLAAEVRSLRAHIRTLEAVPKPPTAAEVVQEFVAGIIASAIRQANAVPGVRMPPVQAPPPITITNKHDPAPSAEQPREYLPRVVICGSKPNQREFLERALEGKVRLRWWKEDSPQSAKDLARTADMVYLVTGFIGHSVEETVRSVTDKFQRVSTPNQETLLGIIEAWLVRWKAEQVSKPPNGK